MAKKLKKAPRSIRRAFPQVEQVIDAKSPVIVHVTDKDCKNAEPLNPAECAMARAAKREFKVDAAVIGLSSSYLIKGKKAIRFNTGEAIAREIVSFDRHSDFQPGTYTLVPKSRTDSFKYHKEYDKKRVDNRGKRSHQPKRKYHHTAKIREFRIT